MPTESFARITVLGRPLQKVRAGNAGEPMEMFFAGKLWGFRWADLRT